MPIQYQTVKVPILGGMNTKLDDMDLPEGQMSQVINGEYSSVNKITKRRGQVHKPSDFLGGGGLGENGFIGQSMDDDGANVFVNTEINNYVYSEALQKLVFLGRMYNIQTTFKNVEAPLRESQTVINGDITTCIVGNYQFYFYRSLSGGTTYNIVVSVQDIINNVFIHKNIVVAQSSLSGISQDAVRMRAVPFDGSCLIIFRGLSPGFQLTAYKVVADAAAPVSGLAWQTNDFSDGFFDAIPTGNGTDGIVTYKTATGFRVRSFNLTSLSTTQTQTIVLGTPIAGDLACTMDFNDSIYVIFGNTSNNVLFYIFNYAAAITTVTNGTVDTLGIQIPHRITATTQTNNGSGIKVFFEVEPTSGQTFMFIKSAFISAAGGISGLFEIIRGMRLLSKAFVLNSIPALGVSNADDSQPGGFVIDQYGTVISRMGYGQIGGSYHSDVAVITYNEHYRFVAASITGFDVGKFSFPVPIYGLSSIDIKKDNERGLLTVRSIRGTYVLGGMLKYYDGSQLVEQGFNTFPTVLSLTPGGGGTLTPSATYGYSAIYSWTDADGRVHVSAPAVINTVTLTAGQSSVSVVVSTLRATEKRNVLIKIYKTKANQSALYYLTEITNNPVVDSATFNDNASVDSGLVDLLYTESGEVPNEPVPSPRWIAARGDRIFAIVDDNELWYSKPELINQGAGFSSVFSIEVSNMGGKLQTLGVIDDKLIILAENMCFSLSGDGPNVLAQGDFFGPQIISGNYGVTDKRATLSTEYGVFFKGKSGIYLLDRSLSYSHVGLPMDALNSYPIIDANIFRQKNQIRFATTTFSMVFDTVVKKWSIFQDTTSGCRAVASYNGLAVYMRGSSMSQEADVYYDEFTEGDTNDIQMILSTGWIHLAGIQGFQRIKRVSFIGKKKSEHELRVVLLFNYSTNLSEAQHETIDSSTIVGDPYQVRILNSYQKIESIRITILDAVSNLQEGYEALDLTLELALKPGIFRTGLTRTY